MPAIETTYDNKSELETRSITRRYVPPPHDNPGWRTTVVEANVEIEKIKRTSLEPDHRPRPSPESLLRNMTGQKTQSTWIRRCGRYSVTQSAKNYHKITYHTYMARLMLPGGFPSVDWMTPLRLKIKAEAVNVGTSLAELPEAIGQFAAIGVALHRGYKRLRRNPERFFESIWSDGTLYRGKRRNLSQGAFRRQLELNDVAASHLLVEFGIRPMLSDLVKICDRLDFERQQGITKRFTVTSKEAREGVSGSTEYNNKVSAKARFYVTFNVGSQDFTLGNPAEVAWELFPGSFLLDYVASIGDFLSSLDALKDVKSMIGTVTTKSRSDSSYRKSVGGVASSSFYTHKRVVYYTVPIGRINWNPSFNYNRLKNIVALISVLRTGRKR